ncbi:hypothetical protein ACJX0J_012301, partial [Zea mays]
YNKLNQIFRGGEPHIPKLCTVVLVHVLPILQGNDRQHLIGRALCFVFLNFNNALPICILKKLSCDKCYFSFLLFLTTCRVAIRAQVLLIDIAFNLHYQELSSATAD